MQPFGQAPLHTPQAVQRLEATVKSILNLLIDRIPPQSEFSFEHPFYKAQTFAKFTALEIQKSKYNIGNNNAYSRPDKQSRKSFIKEAASKI